MKKEETIEVLNTLITINNDRIEGYENAKKLTYELDLKAMFSQFISTSKKCNKELIKEVNTLSGEIADGTKTSGKFFRVWMDVKTALTDNDRKAILNSCEYGEEKARETYDKVLENDFDYLNAKQHFMVNTQMSLLKVDNEHLKLLRHALVDA